VVSLSGISAPSRERSFETLRDLPLPRKFAAAERAELHSGCDKAPAAAAPSDVPPIAILVWLELGLEFVPGFLSKFIAAEHGLPHFSL
jgi:hypothetical protein